MHIGGTNRTNLDHNVEYSPAISVHFWNWLPKTQSTLFIGFWPEYLANLRIAGHFANWLSFGFLAAIYMKITDVYLFSQICLRVLFGFCIHEISYCCQITHKLYRVMSMWSFKKGLSGILYHNSHFLKNVTISIACIETCMLLSMF